MKMLLASVVFLSTFSAFAGQDERSCAPRALKVVKSILKDGGVSSELPSDTLYLTKSYVDKSTGATMETVEVVWKSSFRNKVSMTFFVEERTCSLDLGSLKVEKN